MKKLGFGCMRLPMLPGKDSLVDQEQFNRMVDRYMEAGFCYFDTAHVYIKGQSETALREGLVKRYPREQFFLVDKLSGSQFHSKDEIRPFFERQLAATGTSFFDGYLMHSLTAEGYEKFTACHAFEIAAELKAEGKIRHMGISFHDKPAVLEQILTEHPEIEAVQIQLNYLDYDSPSIQSKAVYDVCRKFEKPVLVMEPVKGGHLAQLPPEADQVLAALGGGSAASYAIRYAASFPGVVMVLSGMSTYEQMEDNLSYMMDFRPIDNLEMQALEQVRSILKKQDMIACTACRYCVAGCPKHIQIPDLFSCFNTKKLYHDWNSDFYYEVHSTGYGKASDCISCRKCQRICPQHLEIPELLKMLAAEFEG